MGSCMDHEHIDFEEDIRIYNAHIRAMNASPGHGQNITTGDLVQLHGGDEQH